MDDRIRAAASAAAHQLLLLYREEHPQWQDDQTPLDDLVDWLGLQVETFHPNDYPPGTYGFLEPGEDLIWLSRELSAALRRFTLAHELGHAALHRAGAGRIQQLMPVAAEPPAAVPELSLADPCQQPDVQEEGPHDIDLFEDALGGVAYDPRSERELAANLFAAELLMPLERVRALYLEQRAAPRRLAGIFDVSNEAMLNRLAALLPQESGQFDVQMAPQPRREAPGRQRAYDEFQQAAIEVAPPALVVAGPGSGKTSALIGRVAYLIAQQHIDPGRILALTFSRKAAQEMAERLQHLLSQSARVPPTVSTFHAFCANVLRKHALLAALRPDFTLVDETEGYLLLREQARHMQLYHYRNLVSPAYHFADFQQAIARAKDELVTPERYRQLAQAMLEEARDEESATQASKALEIASIYALYEEELRRRGDCDFGGLIMQTVRLFAEHPEVSDAQRQQFQHILVDEFQDINRASGVLLRQLAGEERRVWVVGDANQAIYSFRGASPANIANFQQDYPGAPVLPLSRNYRSLPDIVNLAESFRLKQLEADRLTGEVTNQAARLTQPAVSVTLAEAADSAAEVAGLIADMRHKHAQGFAYGAMAVLCRTRARANTVTRALRAAELPVIEQPDLLNQPHIKDLISILLLLTDTSGMGILRAARRREHALTQSDIEVLLAAWREQASAPGLLIARAEIPLHVSSAGRRSLGRLSVTLQSLAQTSSGSWSLLARYLFGETSIIRDLLHSGADRQSSAVLADYAALLQIARRFDRQRQAQYARQVQQSEKDGLQPPQLPGIQQRAQEFLDYLHILLRSGQSGGSRQQAVTEKGPDVISVMTVHASKGLEFPVVYLPGLIARNFPLQKQGDPVPLPAGILPAGSTDTDVHESGEACLFYVGVSRARDRLVLSYARRNGKQGAKPSPYLEALLAGLPAERITRQAWQQEPCAREEVEETTALPETETASQPGANFLAAARPAALQASAIETYQRCPRQYLYRCVYGFYVKEGGYRLFWQATQQTLDVLQQQWASGDSAQEALIPTLEEVHELYMRHWQALGGDEQPFAAIYEEHASEVSDQLRRLLRQSSVAHWELRPDLTVEVAGRMIHVPVDRVETPAGAGSPVRFVRTRLGKSRQQPAAGVRELLYARSYRQHYAAQGIEMHLHNLSTGETAPITLTPRKEQSLYNELEQAIMGIERDEYPPRPDPRTCPDCAFFFICPA